MKTHPLKASPLFSIPLLAVSLSIVGFALAVDSAQAEDKRHRVTRAHNTDYVPSEEVVTPHVAFAKPIADALRAKVLFAVWAPSARQVIELKQRMDFDFDFVSAGNNNLLWRGSGQNNLAAGTAGEDEVGRITELLQKNHDVIVLGSVRWAWYPEAVQNRILAAVESGTGLVVTPYRTHATAPGTDKLGELNKAAKAVTSVFPAEGVRTVTHGKGRIAFVDDPTYSGYYDTHIGGFLGRGMERIEPFARTMLWAAKKEPKTVIEPKLQISNYRVQVTGGPGLTVAVYRDLDTAYPVLYGAMPYELRPYATLEKVEPASSNAQVHDYQLSAGPYLLIEQSRDSAGKVTNWRQTAIKVPGEVKVDAVELQMAKGAVPLSEKDPVVWIKPGDKAKLTVRVSGAPEGATSAVTLSDREGRVVATAKGPLQGGVFTTELDTHRVLHHLLLVTVTVDAPSGPLTERRAPLLVDFTPPWRSPHQVRTFGTALMRPELTGNAISYFPGYDISHHNSRILHAWYDETLNTFFGTSVFEKGTTNEKFERTPSFFDSAYLEKQREGTQKLFEDTRTPGNPGKVMVVVDEWAYGYVNKPGGQREPDWPSSLNQDRSPVAMKAFGEYLKKEYKDLAALNAAWASDFKTWDQVEPYLFTGKPEEAPPEKAWASIVDHLAFSYQGIANYLKEMADSARAVNPRNKLSASAFYSLGMLTGVDHYLWAKYAPHIVMYYDWQIWDSFSEEHMGRWFGYGASLEDPMQERFRAWKHLLREIEGTSWSREEAFFHPDHTPNVAAAAYYEELNRACDDGLTNLIRAGESVNEIGILYHPRSFFVHSLKDWTARSDMWWKQIVRRKKSPDYLGRYIEEGLLPWESRFVAMEQIEKSEFGRFKKPKVIILPLSEALSDHEVAVLRKFVEEGGVLVGDLNTAMRQTAGNRRTDGRGALDDLFGLTRHGYVDKVTVTPAPWDPKGLIPVNFRSYDETQQSVDDVWPLNHAFKPMFEARFADGKATLTPVLGGAVELAKGATAQATLPDGQPAFIVNTVGKGKAIYLNYLPWDETTYDRIRVEAGIPLQRYQIEEGKERIVETVREMDLDGQLYLGVLTRIWGMGNRWISTPEQKDYRKNLANLSSTLRLKAKAHVYDSRRGTYLGLVDAIPVKFNADWAADFFAAMPYQVKAVEVKAVSASEGGAPVIDFDLAVKAEGGKAGTHVLSVTVLNPQGKPVPSYSQRITARDGAGKGRVWLASDDPKGPWTIRVRDAATGVKGEAVVK